MKKEQLILKVGHLYRTYQEYAEDVIMISKIEAAVIHYYYLDDPDTMCYEDIEDAERYGWKEIK